MTLQDFTVSTWLVPHKAFGHFVEIDVDLVRDGPGGAFQSFEHAKLDVRNPELDVNQPHRWFKVTEDQVASLGELADEIVYSFREQPYVGGLGYSTYGLRVSRGIQIATVSWWGRFEDQLQSVRNLYSAIQRLAEA